MPVRSEKLVVRCFMMSVDGFVGLNQRLEQPFGDHTEGFTDWMFATRSGSQMLGLEGGEENADDPYVAYSFDNIGAAILGRNMFGTSRGPWTDDGWNGWWGPNPPYHAPTFVLTHHPREPLAMEGGTTFHFATQGIDDALERAFAAGQRKGRAAHGRRRNRPPVPRRRSDRRTPLRTRADAHRSRERIFPESSPPPDYTCVERTATAAVVHLRFERR